MFISVPLKCSKSSIPFMMRLDSFDKIYIQNDIEDDTWNIVGRDTSGKDIVILKCESLHSATLTCERIEEKLSSIGELLPVFEVIGDEYIELDRAPEDIPF